MKGRLQERNGKFNIVISYQTAGKNKQKWISTGLAVKNNKRKAEQMLMEALREFEQQQEQREELCNSMTMKQLIEEWLSVKKITVRPSSYEAYRITAESQVIPYFEELGLSVQELTPTHVQRYFTNRMEKGFKASTMPKHNTVIHGALDYAIETLGIIETNPADRIKLPPKKKRLPTFYTDEQLKRLFQIMEGESIEAAVRISATYGLRRSEVLGLKWGAVDFKRKTIIIQHTAVRVGSETVRDDMVKELASFRTMPLMDNMEVYLKRLYAHQRKMKKLCGKGYHDNDYICKWDNGELFDPNFITRKFRQLLEQHQLSKIRFHDLRHSSASLLINMGFTLKEVQEWLGHADIASTEIYAHLLYKSKEGMAAKINKALSTAGNVNPTEQAS